MKNLIKLTFAFFISILLISTLNSCGSSASTTIKLTDLDAKFEKFMRNPEYDNITDSIEYVEVGKENYDNLFKESAKIYATVRQLNFLLGALEKNPSMFVKPPGFDFAQATVSFGINALPKMKESASTILSSLTSLNPSTDFTGLDAVKAPKAVSGISQTKTNLENAVGEIGKLTERLSKLADQFK